MDEIDQKILEELLKNSRQSFREISKKVGVAVGTVLTRIKSMEKEGIIEGYTVILNHEKLGYELTAIIELTVSKGRLLEVDREVAKRPNVCAVYDTTGLTDAIIIAKFKTREELSKFTKTLLAIPHVERTNTHLVLTTIKEDFRLV
ncbi:AsnC family transcriptional regulator [Candidatus Bathyarchaeota archaeon]|nr:MAG: AsnC family transcriptional regulator [Candidatus Bathyarchaeota archaeon]